MRRSRRRFWDGDPAALATLHECLDILTRLLAPFVPFVTEQVWSALFAPTGRRRLGAPGAVGPRPKPALIDAELGEQVALVRRLVELGRAARAESGMKTRQPLARALVGGPGLGDAARRICAIRSATNSTSSQLANLADTGELVELSVKPNFRALGRRFGGSTQSVANAVIARRSGRAGRAASGGLGPASRRRANGRTVR